jgi:undecaprenyl-diphosphatase
MNPNVLSGETSIFVTFLASFLIWVMFGGFIFLWIIDGRVKKEIVLHALLATLISWVAVQMIKGLLPIERPFVVDGILPLTLTIPNSNSFPSGHSAVAFAGAISIWLHNKKLGGKFIILASLVALGRVLSHVHSILDIIVGGGLGVLSSYVIGKLHLYKLIDKK